MQAKSKKIALIGAGNMAGALVLGLTNNAYPAENIWVSNPTTTKLDYFQQQFHVHVTTDNTEAAALADVIIFAIKPKQMQTVCTELKAIIEQRAPLLVSVATGISSQVMQRWLGDAIHLVCAMPNTASAVSAGVTGLYAKTGLSQAQKDLAESIFRAVGITFWLEQESLLNAVTATSGSGPAYFFYVMEAMQQAAQDLGVDEAMSRLLVAQTALGAARMVMESDQDIAQLREYVTSPQGTTEQAIQALANAKVKESFTQAVFAASKRAHELAEQVNNT